jgi:hypothetical protein
MNGHESRRDLEQILYAESAGCEALRAEHPVDAVRSALLYALLQHGNYFTRRANLDTVIVS